MWHVSSRSGVATLRTAIHLLLTCYFLPVSRVSYLAYLCFYLYRVFRTWRGECHVDGVDDGQVRRGLDVAVFRVATADVRHHHAQLFAGLPIDLHTHTRARQYGSITTDILEWPVTSE